MLAPGLRTESGRKNFPESQMSGHHTYLLDAIPEDHHLEECPDKIVWNSSQMDPLLLHV